MRSHVTKIFSLNIWAAPLRAACLLALLIAIGCERKPSRIVIDCGGPAKFPCPSGMFCDLGTGTGCGGFDAVGACRLQPQNCPLEDSPVCSCNKQTFASACYAHASGVTIHYEGPCIKPPKQEKKTGKHFDFPETGSVEAGDVEGAGDVVKEYETPDQPQELTK